MYTTNDPHISAAVADLIKVRQLQKEIDQLEKEAKETLASVFQVNNTDTISTPSGTVILSQVSRESFDKEYAKLLFVEAFGVKGGTEKYLACVKASTYSKMVIKK